jgi:hypothetical protein
MSKRNEFEVGDYVLVHYRSNHTIYKVVVVYPDYHNTILRLKPMFDLWGNPVQSKRYGNYGAGWCEKINISEYLQKVQSM